SIAFNGLDERFTPVQGDLRDVEGILPHAPFDLVTGSPPYWDQADATAADHPQAVPARLEIRGTVADYASTAAAILAPGGVFACVFPDVQDARARAGIAAAGLTLIRTRPVRFKAGIPSTKSGIRLYLAGRTSDLPSTYQTFEEPPLTIRALDGSIDPEYSAIKLSFGFPPG
ncbi:MAG: tRNA1Val (adenine37-N6)-methyltransferase, partial [Myxococcota bacterium]